MPPGLSITIGSDVPDPASALAEISRAIGAGELKLTGRRYALVGGQRLDPETDETVPEFEHRVRSAVTQTRTGFSITVEAEG